MGRTFDLTWLLKPIASRHFLNKYWERSHFTVRRKRCDYYSSLLRLNDLDEVISSPHSTGPRRGVELVRTVSGQVENTASRTLSDGTIDMEHIYSAYGDGFTIRVDKLESRWQPVRRLVRSLESILNHPVGANLYLTPPSAQGFGPHYDDHDVFILQVHGEKLWRVYASPVALPLSIREKVSSDILRRPSRSVKLVAGDLLYIPRGCVHEARTAAIPSMHLTVGINVVRWLDLMIAALKSVAEHDLRYRKALPPGYVTELRSDAVSDAIRALSEGLSEHVDMADLLSRVRAQSPPQIDLRDEHRFAEMDKSLGIGPRSAVRRRSGSRCVLTTSADHVTLHFRGKQVDGSREFGPAFEFIAKSQRFVVSDLPKRLSIRRKVALVKRLIQEGLLTVEA